MTDTLQTAEQLEGLILAVANEVIEIYEDDDRLTLKELLDHPYWRGVIASLKALINSEVTKKLEAVLAVLPEKHNRQHKFFDGGFTAEFTAYADGFDAAIDQVTAAITNLVEGPTSGDKGETE